MPCIVCSFQNLQKMTVPKLRKMLHDRGVSTMGLKAHLVERLKAVEEGDSRKGGGAPSGSRHMKNFIKFAKGCLLRIHKTWPSRDMAVRRCL